MLKTVGVFFPFKEKKYFFKDAVGMFNPASNFRAYERARRGFVAVLKIEPV
jgi:hypothetical protein